MINKLYNNNSKLISLALYLLLISGMIWGYLFSLKYYKSFDFIINEGILHRTLVIIPLLIFLLYTCIFLIPNNLKKLTSLYWYLFLIISIIPLQIVYIMNGIASSKNVVSFLYLIVFISIASIYLCGKIDFKIPSLKLDEKTFWIIIICFMVIGYGYIFYTLGLPNKILLAFKDVYAVRLSYREMAGRFDDYFVQWLGNIVNPFLLACFIYKKKYKLTPLPFVLELILYGYTAYKSLFVTLVLAPIFAELLRRGMKKRLLELVVPLGIFSGILMGYLGQLSLYLFAVLRIFLWPSLIALQYYDFFWMYPKVKLSHSILSHFYTNVYNMEPSFYMGSLYYGRPDMRLNVTWYGDAYMNFGVVGVIAFALILLCIMFFIKSIEGKNIYLVSALLFGGIMGLFNGPILTTLLTNGLGLGLVLAYLLPEKIKAG